MKKINCVGSFDLCGFDFLRIDSMKLVRRNLIPLYQFVWPDFLAPFGLEYLANGGILMWLRMSGVDRVCPIPS
jgi:hypothetical protein